MRPLDALVEALNVLKSEGSSRDFNLCDSPIACPSTGEQFQTHEFAVREYYRFEGATDPADSMILYAVEASDGSWGTFLQAYGAQPTELSAEMSAHLHFADQ